MDQTLTAGDKTPVSTTQEEALRELAGGRLAVCFKNFLSPDEAKKIVTGAYALRDQWTSGFDGAQYSLGEAWYHYAELGIDFEEYGVKAAASRALVEKCAPGLEEKVLRFLAGVAAPRNVAVRDGWAGPGIMVFPAHNHLSEHGGSVHFDSDAFTDEELQNPGLRMFSYVCMLQKPVSGGNLRIWDKTYDRSLPREQTFSPLTTQYVSVPVEYQPGDLWMFNGHNAHRIDPFEGDIDRIALTFHSYEENGDWVVWF